MSKLPLLSIIIPAKRLDDPALHRLLRSFQQQTFQDFEILVETQGNSEEAKAAAVLKARGQIVGFFCADNDFRDRNFLRTMVWYATQVDVDGAYTAQYDYVPYDAPLSRYFALLGANDPLCWWLKKSDRESYLFQTQKFSRQSTISSFSGAIPSLGDNGFFIKRSVLLRAKFTPRTFGSCMCVCEDLRKQGHATYWKVAEQKLWHRTGEDVLDYFSRRWRYVNELYFDRLSTRRWIMVATIRDWMFVFLFAIASLLVVPQLFLSICGYRSVKDGAWFLHPLVCLSLTFLYTCALLRQRLSFRHWIDHRN